MNLAAKRAFPWALRGVALALVLAGIGAPTADARIDTSRQAPPPCTSIAIAQPANIVLGKSTVIRLDQPAARILVGGLPAGLAGKPVDEPSGTRAKSPMQQAVQPATSPGGVADSDVMLLGPSELYLLGKKTGSMNVVIQGRDGRCTALDVVVTVDASALQATLNRMLPSQGGITVTAAADSLVLSGEVGDSRTVDRAVTLAQAYAPERKVVNMLHVDSPQQVMIDVKVAEVSKTLLDSLGAELRARGNVGGWNLDLVSAGGSILDAAAATILSDKIGVLAAVGSPSRLAALNAENDNGVAQVLAEPNIMAISGQQASFLSGGKLFIPVAQTNAVTAGVPTITLQEEDFGIGLKFTPLVLDNGNINLKVSTEVSELAQTGSPFTTVGGVTAILPTFTTRSADTTVQLGDGQSLAIAGLIKNNANESIQRVPGLGDLPILGALFRSASFQKDQTELVFVITPHLIKPLPAHYSLPTDSFVQPGYTDFFLKGRLEGPSPPASAPAAGGGFEGSK